MDGNSELENLTCASWTCKASMPQLQLVAPPTTSAGAYSFQVQFVPGSANASSALDPTATTVNLNGATVTPPYGFCGVAPVSLNSSKGLSRSGGIRW